MPTIMRRQLRPLQPPRSPDYLRGVADCLAGECCLVPGDLLPYPDRAARWTEGYEHLAATRATHQTFPRHIGQGMAMQCDDGAWLAVCSYCGHVTPAESADSHVICSGCDDVISPLVNPDHGNDRRSQNFNSGPISPKGGMGNGSRNLNSFASSPMVAPSPTADPADQVGVADGGGAHVSA